MKKFPTEFEARKEILFYPEKPTEPSGNILEIGPGRGDFILSAAEQCPNKKLVAIELDKRRYFKMIPRIEKKGLTNILLIHGNARIVLPRYFQPGTFEKAYVLFPDPWPKRRHIPNRLMSVEFIQLLADMLKPDHDLFTATDFWPYADMVIDHARQVSSLKNVGRPYFVPMSEIAYYGPSFFEQKWRGEGRTIYYMHYKKI